MSKRKLTDRQTARVQQMQQQRLQAAAAYASTPTAAGVNKLELLDAAIYGMPRAGLLVALFGMYADVEDEHLQLHRCSLRQNLGVVVVGDRIIWRPHLTAETGEIVAIEPRRTLLQRPALHGKSKAVAANIDQLVLVLSAQSKLALDRIDSYLVAAELNQFQVIIALNKCDLLTAAAQRELVASLRIYTDLNYPVICVSAQRRSGLAPLQSALQGHTSIVVGQSGVGKSSLLAQLLPAELIRVAATAETIAHGTHTTTTARLYHLPGGGELIDSPGVRDFRLWAIAPAQIARGFIEFRPYLGQCYFRDCQHVDAARCALLAAVQAGTISHARFASYQRILANLHAYQT